MGSQADARRIDGVGFALSPSHAAVISLVVGFTLGPIHGEGFAPACLKI